MGVFVIPSVSVAELQSHLELDPDSDGSLSETETQVRCLSSSSASHENHFYHTSLHPCNLPVSFWRNRVVPMRSLDWAGWLWMTTGCMRTSDSRLEKYCLYPRFSQLFT
jgi:hypothetical protein